MGQESRLLDSQLWTRYLTTEYCLVLCRTRVERAALFLLSFCKTLKSNNNLDWLISQCDSKAFDLFFLSICIFLQRQIHFNGGAFPVLPLVWRWALQSFCAEMDDQNGEHRGGFVSVPNLNAVGSWSVTGVPQSKWSHINHLCCITCIS